MNKKLVIFIATILATFFIFNYFGTETNGNIDIKAQPEGILFPWYITLGLFISTISIFIYYEKKYGSDNNENMG